MNQAAQKYKRVNKILTAESIDMGGFPVKQALPLDDVRMLDPFLLLHHARQRFDTNQKAIQQGVGPHPHRGFSPVTFVINGEIHHRDSRGNDQVAGKGEVQWMSAGMGLIHSERPSQKIVDEGIEQEIVQLWINTPTARKMDVPKYRHLTASDIPMVESDDQKIRNHLVAGEWRGIKQENIQPDSEMLFVWSKGEKNGRQHFDIPPAFNSMIYVVKGEVAFNGSVARDAQLVLFERPGQVIEMTIKENAEFLLFAGMPLSVRVFQHGPFVMSNRSEILEAIRDYQMGKMGFLVES